MSRAVSSAPSFGPPSPRNVPTLRAATAADLPDIERLLVDAHLPVDGVTDSLATFVVAEHGGNLVGAAGLERCGNDALLRSVVVAPAWQSRGLGRTLVSRTIAEAEAYHLHALYLLTTTAEHYFPAFGFERTTRDAVPADVQATAEFQTACPASATVMRKTLGPSARTP
jgi:amino-acid N-acetyltransferase